MRESVQSGEFRVVNVFPEGPATDEDWGRLMEQIAAVLQKEGDRETGWG